MPSWCGNSNRYAEVPKEVADSSYSSLFDSEPPGPNDFGATESFNRFTSKVQANWVDIQRKGLDGTRLSGKGLRYGQVFFNTLADEHPNLAEHIRSTPRDPFHWDEVKPEIWEYCSEKWDTTFF
jgi:hypothetical protein